MTAEFTLAQVHENPRDGSLFTTEVGTYETLAEAKREAKKAFRKGGRWVVSETTIVATGGGD